MDNLTHRQREILAYLYDFFNEKDQLPPLRMICERFRLSSQNSATDHMRMLERKGHIEKNAVGKYRFVRTE